MPKIYLKTFIKNKPEVIYKLCLNVDLHLISTAKSKEFIIDGIKNGIMKKGDFVKWKAIHFGIWQTLLVKITEETPYEYFSDEMIEGAFKLMKHEHFFEENSEGTIMKDIFQFESPFGIFGKIFNNLILTKYMKNLLLERNLTIKNIAESGEWEIFTK